MEDILDRILARKREEVAAASHRQPPAVLRGQLDTAPPVRGFARALRERMKLDQPAVIAELKKASPSRGLIRADFDPAQLAQDYAHGGAACLSVLTDRDFFQGAPEFLAAARDACELPVLRKDFVVDGYQVLESRVMGADAVLLIIAALDDGASQALADEALGLDMDVLVEVHDAAELDRALALEGDAERLLIGINNRNLRTFDTTLETTLGLMGRVPPDRQVVSESGIFTAGDVARLRAAGVRAYLVGESLMRQPSPGMALRKLIG